MSQLAELTSRSGTALLVCASLASTCVRPLRREHYIHTGEGPCGSHGLPLCRSCELGCWGPGVDDHTRATRRPWSGLPPNALIRAMPSVFVSLPQPRRTQYCTPQTLPPFAVHAVTCLNVPCGHLRHPLCASRTCFTIYRCYSYRGARLLSQLLSYSVSDAVDF